MRFDLVRLDEFLITGIFVRTTNLGGQSQSDIGALWGRFTQEGIIDRIPAKLSRDVYCMYTDYESDFNGFYTALIGCRVSSIDQLPGTLQGKRIPSCTYRLYRSYGKIPASVVETWQNIWKAEIDRKYLADFDLYGIKAMEMNNAEVETYLSVK